MRSLVLCLSLGFLLSACGAAPVEPSQPSPPPSLAIGRPSYDEYSPGAERRPGGAVLFFMEASDPFSQQTDATLRSLFRSDAPVLSVYRVPMTADPAFLRSFGVYVENTVVLVGEDGGRIATLVHPSEQELRQLLMTGQKPA